MGALPTTRRGKSASAALALAADYNTAFETAALAVEKRDALLAAEREANYRPMPLSLLRWSHLRLSIACRTR
jgi:hypothetical protein